MKLLNRTYTSIDVARLLRVHLPRYVSDERHLDYTYDQDNLCTIKCLYLGDEVDIYISEGHEGQVFTLYCDEYSKDYSTTALNPWQLPSLVAAMLSDLGQEWEEIDTAGM